MRSSSMAWLASSLELPVVLLDGGYKAFRRWVLASFERPLPLLLLAGRTGTGKTDLLQALAERGQAVVDLEGLANHRGSSFGGLGMAPSPAANTMKIFWPQPCWPCRGAPPSGSRLRAPRWGVAAFLAHSGGKWGRRR